MTIIKIEIVDGHVKGVIEGNEVELLDMMLSACQNPQMMWLVLETSEILKAKIKQAKLN